MSAPPAGIAFTFLPSPEGSILQYRASSPRGAPHGEGSRPRSSRRRAARALRGARRERSKARATTRWTSREPLRDHASDGELRGRERVWNASRSAPDGRRGDANRRRSGLRASSGQCQLTSRQGARRRLPFSCLDKVSLSTISGHVAERRSVPARSKTRSPAPTELAAREFAGTFRSSVAVGRETPVLEDARVRVIEAVGRASVAARGGIGSPLFSWDRLPGRWPWNDST